MPGPSNKKRSKKSAASKQKQPPVSSQQQENQEPIIQEEEPPTSTQFYYAEEDDIPPRGRQPYRSNDPRAKQLYDASPQTTTVNAFDLNAPSYLTDPGNGPRVTDLWAFMNSMLSDAPSESDPECLDFGSPEVYPILTQLLPTDLALIIWYNKTRETGRICPACRRVYHIGDKLLPHNTTSQAHPSGQTEEFLRPRKEREQKISGLCDWLCFGIAAYRWPGCVEAWGRIASEIDERLIEYMNTLGDPNVKDDLGMGQLIRMTRNEDLGIEDIRTGRASMV
ncbi:hypothetical protein FRC02_008342, partial [Tulasnella sp. 418]